jgi:hypothetical protein
MIFMGDTAQNEKELITRLFEEWQSKQIDTEYDKMINASFPFVPSETMELILFSAGYVACKDNQKTKKDKK